MATDDIERLRFYQQQYLGAQDFEDQQAYHRDMLRRHDLSYHTWGIVAGLELFQQPKENAKDALDIYILPGMAVDGFGRTIFNLQPYPLDTALFQSFGDLNYHTVWLEYTEEPTRPPQVGYEQCDNANQFNRLGETFHVVVDPRAPFHDDITVAGKVAQLPPAHKPPQPGLEPITPYDASVPYQELPDEAGSPRWLIRLGSVKWDGRPGQQQFVQDNTVPPRINEGRQYAGSVTSELLTPAQKLVVRDRSTLVPLPPVDPQNPDGVEMTIEGSLEVNRCFKQMAYYSPRLVSIGIQDATFYLRSDADFCWFRGGSHSNGRSDAGGGALQMKLDNNGALEVHGKDQGFIKFSSIIHPFSVTIGRVSGPHGADSIYGAPNLWLDAANQVFIKQGWATVAMDGAEYFPYSEPVDVGEVVVLDPTKPRSVKATEKAYDTTIIGVVSTNPAFILGGAASEAEIETIKHHYVPVALIGTVPCRVDADIAPIHAGDLLTTSPTRGYAQKVQDSAQASGAILGKALEGLEKGKGLISILVMMS